MEKFIYSFEERPGFWEWAQVALLVANLAWTTACLGGYRPETMVVTSALTGVLVAVHLAARAGKSGGVMGQGDGGFGAYHPAGWWLLPFLGYAAVNVRWISPVEWIGWRDWLGWAQMIAVFWVVLNGVRSKAGRATLFWTLVALAFGAVLLAGYQRWVQPDWLMMGRVQADQFLGRASGPFGIPNSLAALLLLVLPPVLGCALRRGASAVQRVFFGYVASVLALGIVLTVSRGAWLAVAIVVIAWPVVAMGGSVAKRVTWAMGAAAAVAAVVVGLFLTVPLVRERLVSLKTDLGERTRPIMWRGAWKIFEQHPTWGSGGGSYNVLFEKYRPENYQDEPVWAHNDYLNTLSDYGVVGFALFFGACGAIAVGGFRARRRNAMRTMDRMTRGDDEDGLTKAWGAGIAAFLLQLFVDFHFKIPALAMAFAIVSALVVQRVWPMRLRAEGAGVGAGRMRVMLSVVVAALMLGATIGWVRPLYQGEALRYRARQTIDVIAVRGLEVEAWRPVLSEALADLKRAVELAPSNGAAWADLAYATTLWARVEPGGAKAWGIEAEQAADRALALSKVVPEFWLRRAVALDVQGRRVEAGVPLVEALKLAPASATVWYYQAFHLSLDRGERGRARAAVAIALRLDPGNREAQALRDRLADERRAR